MIVANLLPYPEYQKSSVPWLDRVPKHWQTRQLRTLASEPIRNGVGESAQPFRPDWPRYIRITDIAGPRVLRTNTRASLPIETAAAARVKEGDLLLAAVGATYGKSYLHRDVGTPACFAGYLVRLSPNADVRPEFLSYWTESAAYWDQVNSQVIQSTIQNFSAGRYKGLRVSLPPLPEQAAIVRFLDHADRRIRRYIAAKRRLIALLNEQKQTAIHRAVTRGLDPFVSTRPSGVEWLGDVPEHWEVAPLRRRWTVTDCKHLTVPFVEEGIPLASVREVQSFDLDLSTSKHTTMDWYETLIGGGRAPRRGDVIYCRNVSVGAAAFVSTDAPFAMGQDVCLIRSANQNQRYLNYFLHSPAMDRELAMLLVGSTFKRINVSDIKGLIIAMPPRAEQDAIAAHLDQELEHLERPISDAHLQIGLMREYRARFIADVVTGKLDVREAAVRLPNESDEPEPSDDADALAEGDESENETDLGTAAGEAEA